MKPAAYRDIASREVPMLTLEGGGEARVIAGTLTQKGQSAQGPIAGGSTDPLYVDVMLPAGGRFIAPLEPEHNAFVYLYEGEARVGDDGRELPLRAAGLLSAGAQVRVDALQAGAHFLLLAGKPLGEPVVQYGPFVMNTREEIEQALADYRDGTLTAPATGFRSSAEALVADAGRQGPENGRRMPTQLIGRERA
jgi:hypothetical protein